MRSPVRVTYLAQAGFVLSSPGTRLGIDLYLSDCCERLFGFKRLLPAPAKPEELALDFLVATHAHADHLDVDSLPVFAGNPRTRFIGARDCRDVFAGAGIAEDRFVLLRPGECARAGDFSLRAVATDHGSLAPEAVGLVISTAGWTAYFTGDTAFVPDRLLASLGKAALDVLIAPINGAFGNLTKRQAATLANRLKPKMLVPCHFGMFAAHDGDPEDWSVLSDTLDASIELRVMRSGEERIF